MIVLLAMSIPIISIVGGFAVAMFRTHGQQRVAEWAMRERIAAIEKGIDPATLPPLPTVGDPEELAQQARPPRARALELAQWLFVAGAITGFSGLGLAVMFLLLGVGPRNLWAIGALAVFVGAGLVVAGWVVRQGAAEQPDEAPAGPAPLR